MAPWSRRVGVCVLVASGATALVLHASAQPAPTPEQGAIEKTEACEALKSYRDLDAFGKFYFPEAVYEDARTQVGYECRHIWYWSDGLLVSGYVVKPKDTHGRMSPAILYARGGTGEFGLIDDLNLVEFYLLAKEGYVVIGTDYRSVGEKGQRDEWGGAEVNDVLNLVAVAKRLGLVDLQRLFMFGVSRGGTMAYLALKHHIPVRAAAVIAGPTDLEALGTYRPDFLNSDDSEGGYLGWKKVWPDFEHRKAEHFEARSAVAWADQITTPVLIMHARNDDKVPVAQALALAGKLQQFKKEYELVIYANDGHSLPLNRADRNQHIVRWFRTHDSAS